MNYSYQVFEVRKTDVFATWIAQLSDPQAVRRIAIRIARLEAGLLGDVKPVGSGVSEIRIDYGPGFRVYFVQRGRILIVLLCGGDKASQKRDINKAHALAAELEE